MTYPDSFERLWECQKVHFMRQPQGLPTRPQLGLHLLLLLHCPLEVHCLDTCYSRLNRACKAVSNYASRGEELSFFSLQERVSHATNICCLLRAVRCSIRLCWELGTHKGTIWLRLPDRTTSPVLPGASSLEAQGKSSSPRNYGTRSWQVHPKFSCEKFNLLQN